MRAFLCDLADNARTVALALLGAAVLADLAVYVFDTGKAEGLAARLVVLFPPTDQDAEDEE